MQYTLDNGLKVILEPRQGAPVVAIQIWVNVGSADETPDEAGLAHLHEHMLFKGTPRRGPGVIAHSVESCGGEINAWTSFDQTVYHLVLAAPFFHEGLDILVDAVRNPVFDAEELAREIEVVLEEIKRAEDLPSRRLSRALFDTAFSKHPYRAPVLGTAESVRSFTREKMLAFFSKHYVPSNLTLVVVGEFDLEEAKRSVTELLEGPAENPHRRAPRASEPPQTAPRLHLSREEVKETHYSLAFHIPSILDGDLPALDLLALVLGQGESSRLTLALEIEKRLASDAHAYAYTPLDPGLFVAGATAPSETTAEALRATVVELRRLALHPIGEKELATAKAITEADTVYGRETVQGVARKLGFYQTTTGRLDFEAEYYARIAALTIGDLQRVARQYLRPENLTLTALLPREVAESNERLEALVLAAFGEAPEPRVAEPTRRRTSHAQGIVSTTLDNGARIIVKEEKAVPLFAVRAVYPGGLRFETEATNGINQLYSRLLTRATARHSAVELARTLDGLAASLQGSAGRNSIGLRGDFLSKHFEQGMSLFAECLNEPTFESRYLEYERAELLQEIHARDDNPSGAVFELFDRTLFQKHPYRFEPLGSRTAVSGLTADHLRALQRTAFDPRNLTLTIVGDVEPERAFAQAERLFGAPGAPGANEPAVPLEVPQEPLQTAPRHAFRALDRSQAHLVLGYPGLTVRDPERHALELLSSLLSGQGGRLFLELRDKQSLAYSVSSFSIEGLDPGYFGIYLGTSPEKVAQGVEAIREQIARLLNEPIAEAELGRAKRYLIGSHAIGLQKNSARASSMAFDAAFGLPVDDSLHFQEHLEAVTTNHLTALAQRLFHPSRETIALLGPSTSEEAFHRCTRS